MIKMFDSFIVSELSPEENCRFIASNLRTTDDNSALADKFVKIAAHRCSNVAPLIHLPFIFSTHIQNASLQNVSLTKRLLTKRLLYKTSP